MLRAEVQELQYITAIQNVPSILEHGILSHRRANLIVHQSVASQQIQERRRAVVVPGGRPLHDYVNLYLCARNPMMSVLRAQHAQLCILRVSPTVLDVPGTIVADMNASSDYVRFSPAPRGLAYVDRELVFAESWIHSDDRIRELRHKSIKCAEVLVPDRVKPDLIAGAWVSCEAGRTALEETGLGVPVVIDGHLFFR
jgi:hypothetical protein